MFAVSPACMQDRITIQKRNRVKGPFGATETWTDVSTKWACVSQGITTTDNRVDDKYEALTAKNTKYKVMFNGRWAEDFRGENAFADYRFYWVAQDRYLRPVKALVSPGPRRAKTSWVWCEDLTDMGIHA